MDQDGREGPALDEAGSGAGLAWPWPEKLNGRGGVSATERGGKTATKPPQVGLHAAISGRDILLPHKVGSEAEARAYPLTAPEAN